MSDLFAEMEEDADSAELEVGDNQLKAISTLAKEQMVLEDEVAALEEELKQKKKELLVLQTTTLPEALAEAGVAGFTLDNGARVDVKGFVSAKIPAKHEQEAFRWLEENNFGDIIKTQISVDTGKDLELAREYQAVLEEAGADVHFGRSVHAQTLKAFVKKEVEAGTSIPLELFGAFIGQKTTIKR